MGDFRYLDQKRILELHRAMADAGLAKMSTLDRLASSLNRRFAARLPEGDPQNARLLSTLNELNRVERLTNGDVPLAQWLAGVEALISEEPEANIVRAAMRDMQSPHMTRKDAETHVRTASFVTSKDADTHLHSVSFFEKLKAPNRPDMVPYGYLRRGIDVGLSVTRVQVPNYRDGEPILFEGKPMTTLGTGWLLTPELLITNHHVINCDDAQVVPERDLRLQAEGATVQFDYDAPDSPAPLERVARLEAWAPMRESLDYAILRLSSKQDPSSRPPLTLRRTRLKIADPESPPSLNIIQHPAGGPKMLAFRNNHLAKIEGSDIWYFTDTERGSSGSPVLDDDWQVVALHKKWGWVSGIKYYQGKTQAWANVGTQMIDILDDLKARYPTIYREIGAKIAD